MSLSIQTKYRWNKQPPRPRYEQLPCPIVPVYEEYNPMTQVLGHKHAWSQLAYACSGVMHIKTDFGVFVVPPEQALFIPPGVTHEHFCRNRVSYRSLHIDKSFCDVLGDKVRPLTIDPLLKALILEVANWPMYYENTAEKQRFVAVLLDRLIAAESNDLFIPTISDKRLLPIVDAINHQPSNELTLEQWAGQVGASSRTLNRLFNKYCGMGFSQWKQKLRILKSLDLLDGESPLIDIAYELGYQSTSSFITAFKKQMGCSPGKYFNK